jgi:hypothetical protein
VADKCLPDSSQALESCSAEVLRVAERRAFLRRAAIAGLPVVLASVRGRTAWARQDGSASCSPNPSECVEGTELQEELDVEEAPE